MRLRRAGGSALLIECRDGEQVEAWRVELWRRRAAGELQVTDIVPGERTVLLDGVTPASAARLAGWPDPDEAAIAEGPAVEIPATFDGEDLPDVAERWGTTVAETVDRLTGTPLTVAFCGFAPGFAYLTAPDWAVEVPRRATSRERVPAGSVALAAGFSGVYPRPSPGGWQLIGTTDAVLWDVDRDRAETVAERIGASAASSRDEALAPDVVVTVTPGREVVIGPGLLQPGQHVSLMGADGPGKAEMSIGAVASCALFCDEWAQASHGGELTGAVEEGLVGRDRVTDLGAVLAGEAPGRPGPEAVTLFDSTGLAIQDLAVAAAALEAYRDGRVEAQLVRL